MSGMDFPHVFSPLTVGTVRVENRIVATPHAAIIGALWGPSEEEADRNIAYWVERAKHGMSWMAGISAAVENTLAPGFEPTGVGARVRGVYRLPYFHDRMRRMTDALHEHGCSASAQMIMQGGMPHGPSATTTSYVANQVSHEMSVSEIEWFVEEYGYSAERTKEAGLDGVELHANHDDLIEWFLSPSANFREDDYGGDLEGRTRFAREILESIRTRVGSDFTVGMRFNAWEHLIDGYTVEDGIALARRLVETGHLDYVSLAIGDNWGSPSYIQTHHFRDSQWAAISRRYRDALPVPVIYGGRVGSLASAEELLHRGDADLIGMARAWIADPELITKARAGKASSTRPCIGCNECIHRFLVDGLPFGCAVNPDASHELEGPGPKAPIPKDVLVVGGGPAGLETAWRLAARGHHVELWETAPRLGGQLLIAGQLPENAAYLTYLRWLEGQLSSMGVKVHTDKHATPASIRERNPNEVVIATGSRGRALDIPGGNLPHVIDAREAISAPEKVAGRVVVIALEDHMQPLSTADFLASLGHQVHLLYATPGPAPLVGKYSIGAPLGRLAAAGAQFTYMSIVTSIDEKGVDYQNVYSDTPGRINDIDTVVVAAGGTPDVSLARALEEEGDLKVHIIGDAYAPRRITFATSQARAVARML